MPIPKDATVNARDLVKLLREWKRRRPGRGANHYTRGERAALDAVILLLTDDEARSTISVSGYTT